MVELGLIIGVAAIILAFEEPRQWVVERLWRRPSLEHTFAIRTAFRAHNDGAELGPLGTNKSERSYELQWTIRNLTSRVLQLERSVIMRPKDKTFVGAAVTFPQMPEMNRLYPDHRLDVLTIELTRGETEHLRHWVNESSAFGIKDSVGNVHWIPDDQFKKVADDLQRIAIAHGLPEVVPKGRAVMVRVVRVGSKSGGSGRES